jgi:hypothetical protein
MCVSVAASSLAIAATLAAQSLTLAASRPTAATSLSPSGTAVRPGSSSLGVQVPVGSNNPSPARPGIAAKPPYPGATDVGQILANIQAGIVAWRLQRQIPLDLRRDRAKITVRAFFEVEGDTKEEYYYWVDVDKLDGTPVLTAQVDRESGYLMGLLSTFANGKRKTGRPDLEAVKKQLSLMFGATDARYYCTLGANFGVVNPLMPAIAARTPKGRVYVDWFLSVWEETGFDKDPPGITEEAKVALRQRQRQEGPNIIHGDGVERLRKVARLQEVDRR